MKLSNKKDYSFIKRLCSTFSLIILFVNISSGQNYKYINNTNHFTPFFLIICQDDFFNTIKDSITNIKDKTEASFLLVNASQESKDEIIDTVNQILNKKEYLIDKTKIYLIIVGDKIFFEKQNQFSNSLFPSRYFVQTDNQIINSSIFKTVHYNNMNLTNIVNKQIKSKLWQHDLERIRKLSTKDNNSPYIPSWEFGFGFSKDYPGPIRTDDDFPADISAFEIQISRSLSKKYKIWSSITFNKLMFLNKKKDEMQPISMDVDKQLAESILFVRSLNLTRLFYVTQSPVFVPFIALGISHTNLSLMYVEANGNIPDMEMKIYSCGSLKVTSGLEINLAEKIRFNSKISYHISLNTYNTMNNFNVTFGLSYMIQRKKEPFYQYLRKK